MNTRNRFWAVALIIIGLTMIFGKWMGFFTIVALILLVYGVYKIRQGEEVKTGYLMLGIGAGIILLDHLGLVVAICVISLAVFFFRAKKAQPRTSYVQKYNFLSSIHWDLDPWVLRSIGMWHVLGELDIDLSLAIVEGDENTLMFQGVIGDLDLVLSDNYGLEIDAFVFFGRIGFGKESETGMMNRVRWRSPEYETKEQKIKIVIYYLVGDVDIRLTY